MSTNELAVKVKTLKTCKAALETLKEETQRLEDEIKAEMRARDTDTLRLEGYHITWRPVTSRRVDMKAMRKDVPAIVNLYTRTETTRRFLVV